MVAAADPQTLTSVIRWRLACLEAAGYPGTVAMILARELDVDLHDACGLLEHGATPLQAVRILL